MARFATETASSRPRWDGSRILFEILDGNEPIACAISRGALEDISEKRYNNAAGLLACFAQSRARIEGLAMQKFRARSAGSSGRVNLWADDVEILPPDDVIASARPELAGAARR